MVICDVLHASVVQWSLHSQSQRGWRLVLNTERRTSRDTLCRTSRKFGTAVPTETRERVVLNSEGYNL